MFSEDLKRNSAHMKPQGGIRNLCIFWCVSLLVTNTAKLKFAMITEGDAKHGVPAFHANFARGPAGTRPRGWLAALVRPPPMIDQRGSAQRVSAQLWKVPTDPCQGGVVTPNLKTSHCFSCFCFLEADIVSSLRGNIEPSTNTYALCLNDVFSSHWHIDKQTDRHRQTQTDRQRSGH